MKLAEMVSSSRKSNSQQDFGSICKVIYEDYYNVVERKCDKIYSNNSYMDKEDIIHDVICNSVEQHQKRKRLGKMKHSTTGVDLDRNFLFQKCIEAGATDFIRGDSSIMDKPHIRVEGKNYLSQVVVIDEPINSKGKSDAPNQTDLWRDIIQDNDLKEPVDRLIYEEYIEELINSIDEFEENEKPKGFWKKSPVDLKKLTKMLLVDMPVKEIKDELGVSTACISRVRRDILLPLVLMLIDDPIYYRKYSNSLSEKAKKIIIAKKGIVF